MIDAVLPFRFVYYILQHLSVIMYACILSNGSYICRFLKLWGCETAILVLIFGDNGRWWIGILKKLQMLQGQAEH